MVRILSLFNAIADERLAADGAGQMKHPVKAGFFFAKKGGFGL